MIINGYTIGPGADLSGANLSGANLSETDLSGANLRLANLRLANLSGANLSGANLSETDLSGANLSGANLSETDLSGANLRLANLRWANLSETDLSGANLRWANLSGAIWKTREKITKAPVQITGLFWEVLILDNHMQIGCQCHPVKAWESFDDATIIGMDGRNALRFWRQHKTMLISLAKDGQQSYAD